MSGSTPLRYRFPASLRLLRRPEFQAVYAGGKQARRRCFALFCLPMDQLPTPPHSGPSRLGITATRKAGNSVVRNRLRRRMREIYRLHQHQIKPGYALVANMNRAALSQPWEDLIRQFRSAMVELQIWCDSVPPGEPAPLKMPQPASDHRGSGQPLPAPDPETGLAGRLAILGLRGYKRLISPILPPLCRFEPTCSEYAMEAYRKKPFIQATVLTCWRLCRCNPWSKGGYDPVE